MNPQLWSGIVSGLFLFVCVLFFYVETFCQSPERTLGGKVRAWFRVFRWLLLSAGEGHALSVKFSLNRLRLQMCNWQLRARANLLRRIADMFESRLKFVRLCAQCLDFLYSIFVGHIDSSLP
jgi:hypothetical protein